MTIPKLTPYTGQVANPDGSQTQTEFTQNMFDQLSYEAQLATQLDATIDGMNNAVDEVKVNATSAENSANAAEAAASTAGYKGLWPDTGGSALKGEIWQTQAGGTPTGKYYTALQDTSVDPVGDNVNWKVNVSASNVRNPNLLSNGQFKFASPDDSLPAPSATPQDYPAGFQIFSGWFADDVNGASGVTRVNGILNWTQDGVSSIYTLVPKDGDLTEYAASLAGKVSGAITSPDTSHVSFGDNGDGNWRITIANSATDIYSCKFEQGSVATGHDVQISISDLVHVDGFYKLPSIGSVVDGIEKIITNKRWYAFESPDGNLLSFTDNNDYGTATMVTSSGTYEFVSFEVLNMRKPLNWPTISSHYDAQGWGGRYEINQDDYLAITSALEYAKNNGGGTVLLSKAQGKWKTSDTIRIPSFCTLEGVSQSRYPYNSDQNSCSLVASFETHEKWVIDSETKNAGSFIPYNQTLGNVFPDEATYNSCVKNIQIESETGSVLYDSTSAPYPPGTKFVPYGAIRMIGCPGAKIDDCSSLNTGIGMLVNYCFGGEFNFHALSYFYGSILWESANSNDCRLYSNQQSPNYKVVPDEYLPPFMNNLNGSLVPDGKLSTNAHYNRAFGLIVGSDSGTSSSGNNINYTGEKFSGGCFQYFSYGTTFDKFYVEGSPTQMDFGMVSAFSRWTSDNYHCYLSDNNNNLFDLGVNNNIRCSIVGLRQGKFGFGPFEDSSSLVVFDAVKLETLTGFIPKFNVSFTNSNSEYNFAAGDFTNGWGQAGGILRPAGVVRHDQTNEIHLRGAINGGSANQSALTLPTYFRPQYAVDFQVNGGTVRILASGEVIPGQSGVTNLDQIRFDLF